VICLSISTDITAVKGYLTNCHELPLLLIAHITGRGCKYSRTLELIIGAEQGEPYVCDLAFWATYFFIFRFSPKIWTELDKCCCGHGCLV